MQKACKRHVLNNRPVTFFTKSAWISLLSPDTELNFCQYHYSDLNWDNADSDGNAIIDAADPKCSRCNIGDETPLHLLSECEPLGDLRRRIFGREDLVGPGEISDFSEFKAYQIISFFKEANFDT